MIKRKSPTVHIVGTIVHETLPERVSMSLGKQILHGIYNGVDAGMTELLHGEYDKEFGVVDPVNGFHGNDKFDRAMIKQDLSAVLSPAATSADPASTSADPSATFADPSATSADPSA